MTSGRRRRRLGWGLCVGLALSLGSPRAWARVGPEPVTRHATLKIDTSQVGDAGPIVKRRVEERGTIVLREAAILPARDDRDDAVISVVVQEMRGEEPGFVFELWVQEGGEVVGERRRVECTLCTESEIVERIERELQTATALVGTATEGEGNGEVEDGAGGSGQSEGNGEVDGGEGEGSGEADQARGLGPKGKAGVALLALGGAGLATGLGLALAPPKVDESNPLWERSTLNPGIGVLAGAGVALVVGGVLLGLDRRDAKRRAVAWTPTPTPTPTLWIGRGVAGASFSARF